MWIAFFLLVNLLIFGVFLYGIPVQISWANLLPRCPFSCRQGAMIFFYYFLHTLAAFVFLPQVKRTWNGPQAGAHTWALYREF
jgi:hypothetical protein